jgi:hypothetical protein
MQSCEDRERDKKTQRLCVFALEKKQKIKQRAKIITFFLSLQLFFVPLHPQIIDGHRSANNMPYSILNKTNYGRLSRDKH